MPSFCAQCGTALPSEAKFCEECGAQVGEGVATAVLRPRRMPLLLSLFLAVVLGVGGFLLFAPSLPTIFSKEDISSHKAPEIKTNTSKAVPEPIKHLIFISSKFVLPLTIAIPREDNRAEFEEMSRKKVEQGLPTIHMPMGSFSNERGIINFLVKNDFARLEKATLTNSYLGTKEYKFFFYNESLAPHIYVNQIFNVTETMLALAARKLESIDYVNLYEAAPAGIKMQFYALTFSYTLEKRFPGLPDISRRFHGKAKAYLDPDDGQWKLWEDPELEDSSGKEYLSWMNANFANLSE